MSARKALAYLVVALLFAGVASSADKPKSKDDYQPTPLNLVLTTPEDMKNKLITFESVYIGVKNDFPRFFEDMGFKNGKYSNIRVRQSASIWENVPLLVKRTEEMKSLLATLKPNQRLAIYGKIKKFQHTRPNGDSPSYYVDIDIIEVIQESVTPTKPSPKKLDSLTPKPPHDLAKPK